LNVVESGAAAQKGTSLQGDWQPDDNATTIPAVSSVALRDALPFVSKADENLQAGDKKDGQDIGGSTGADEGSENIEWEGDHRQIYQSLHAYETAVYRRNLEEAIIEQQQHVLVNSYRCLPSRYIFAVRCVLTFSPYEKLRATPFWQLPTTGGARQYLRPRK